MEPGYLFLGSRLGNSLLLKYTEKLQEPPASTVREAADKVSVHRLVLLACPVVLCMGQLPEGSFPPLWLHRKSLPQRRSEWTPQQAGQVRAGVSRAGEGLQCPGPGSGDLCVHQEARRCHRTRSTKLRCMAVRPSQAHSWPPTPSRFVWNVLLR